MIDSMGLRENMHGGNTARNWGLSPNCDSVGCQLAEEGEQAKEEVSKQNYAEVWGARRRQTDASLGRVESG